MPIGARHGGPIAIPVGAHAVHWPDLMAVLPDGRLVAVEVELMPKPTATLRTILRAYQQAERRVLYLGTEPVVCQLQGRAGPEGWTGGVAQEVGLLPSSGAAPGPGDLVVVAAASAAKPANQVPGRVAVQDLPPLKGDVGDDEVLHVLFEADHLLVPGR
ncbi:hypothetical protein ACWCO0_25810 [Streptomyces tubercidicus]